MLSFYWQAIKIAVEQGYRGDPKTGHIYGKSGKRLKVERYGKQQYPTIRLHVDGLPASAYSVHAHKFMGFVVWGEAALVKGVHVRHRDGNPNNLRGSNLLLGTPSQNNLDKSAAVRQASAKAARAAQGRTPHNAVLSTRQADEIRRALSVAPRGPLGRIRRGVVKDLSRKYGVSPSAISCVGKGRSWVA